MSSSSNREEVVAGEETESFLPFLPSLAPFFPRRVGVVVLDRFLEAVLRALPLPLPFPNISSCSGILMLLALFEDRSSEILLSLMGRGS